MIDRLIRKGYAIADRRAQAANPDLADRERRRRSNSRVVITTSDDPDNSDLTLDSFFADLATVRSYRPAWLRALLKVKSLNSQNGIAATYHKIISLSQRVRRGYADSDVWNLDIYLAETIRNSVRDLRNTTQTHPTYMTSDEWLATLDAIADGFNAYLSRERFDVISPTEYAEGKQAIAKGMRLLTENFEHLWC